jgi:hypothetical protein
MNRRMAVAVAAVVATNGPAARAHHSIATVYDSSRKATIEGVVAKFHLVNPHPFLLIDVTDGDGRVQRWRLEMDNRHELAEIGVTANTFVEGDRIVVTGSLARTHGQGLYVLRLDRPADGFWYEQVGPSPKIRNPSRETIGNIRAVSRLAERVLSPSPSHSGDG